MNTDKTMVTKGFGGKEFPNSQQRKSGRKMFSPRRAPTLGDKPKKRQARTRWQQVNITGQDLQQSSSHQIWKWEIVNRHDPYQDNGRKLFYCHQSLTSVQNFEFIRPFRVGPVLPRNVSSFFQYFKTDIVISVLRDEPNMLPIHWCAKIKDEVEKLAYQLNEEAERTERPIRRLIVVVHEEPHPQMTGTLSYRPEETAGEIARHTTQATGRPISRFTVARRLHGGGLFARRPVRCAPLTPAHRRRRSLWCREHRNWRDNEWGRVLFTDESRFSLSSDSHRILIRREWGSRNYPSNIIETDRYGGRGVLVWRGIMLGSRTDLHIFDAGSVNGTRYCNEILLPHMRLFRGAMGLQFLFMDDNAPYHRTVAAEQLLESKDIERMVWPARSPDLKPIEHVWDFLGRRLAARTLPPVTIRELRLALQDEWAAMPQQLIDTLILSMGRRCETCLAVRGDHIPY
ncbi:transposable element Tcb2 transposase [Trichonephila clavipes]|nr:transposable element Tcb2 transposase [Trichonephila clavipes]